MAGLKLTAAEVGHGIAKREANDPKLAQGVLDPSAFKEDGGPSVAEGINNVLLKNKLAAFRPADNTRVSSIAGRDRRGPLGGWDQMRSRLIGDGKGPMLFFFAICAASIRTIPVLQHDPMKPEDLDTNSEDHAADMVRYATMARPWLKTPKPVNVAEDAYRPYSEEYLRGIDIDSCNLKLL
jgi:hypothetical protein